KLLRDKQEKTLNVTVEELDLEAEQTGRAGRSNNNREPQEEETGSSGFGIGLRDLTPQMARRLQLPPGRTGALITDVDPNGPGAAALRAGDIILAVNRKPVSSAVEASRELGKVASGHIAQILVWRGDGEAFVTVKKD